MGYDVHITRAVDWFDSEQTPILFEEWTTYIEHDPELRLDGFAAAPLADGTELRMESPGLAVWTAYSGHQENGNKAWFNHSRRKNHGEEPRQGNLGEDETDCRDSQGSGAGG